MSSRRNKLTPTARRSDTAILNELRDLVAREEAVGADCAEPFLQALDRAIARAQADEARFSPRMR